MTSTTPDTGTSSTGLKATDVVESLTGYDEAKIEQHWGAPVEVLGGAKFMRALLFGHFLHEGVEAKTAHKQVMGMTQAAVADYFADEEDDDDGSPDAGTDGAAPDPGEPLGEPPVAPELAAGRPIGDVPQA